MRLTTLMVCLTVAACREGAHRRGLRVPLSDSTSLEPLATAPVIRTATVVAFWLAASDTLKEGEGGDQLADFRNYTGLVAPLLAEEGIPLIATTADSVVVELEQGPRRVIMLAGLDYPFGYVLVEPGFPETILTGVSTDDELLDQAAWYFGLDEEDDSTVTPRVVRSHAPGRPLAVRGVQR